jgi:regulator of sirC expression with transglutaminase-like and TPR domain
VIERRTGIPVSLSVVYLLIARRLRAPIYGINLPVHFICQYRAPGETFLIDPFHHGRVITRAECVKLLHGSGMAFDESMLKPVSARKIIARMARNLVLIYSQHHEISKATLLDRILKMLRVPD